VNIIQDDIGSDSELLKQSHDYTLQVLEKHGNTVSDSQSKELHRLLSHFVELIDPDGGEQKRLAFSLPCGAGKTTAIRGFCKALNTLGKSEVVVICAEKVEGLCQLKRDLVNEDGIPEGKVSLLHSYKYDPDFTPENPTSNTASEPSDKPKDLKQFILMTHSKLQQGFDSFHHNLLIYDESLLLGKADTMQHEGLVGEIGYFKEVVEDRGANATGDSKELSSWLEDVKRAIKEGKDDGDINGHIISFPDLPIETQCAKKAIKAIMGKGKENLLKLVKIIDDKTDVRIMSESNQQPALITYEQTIPDDLQKIAILDASYSFRELLFYDETIKEVEPHSTIKDHSDVTIHLCKAKVGRTHTFSTLNDSSLFTECGYLTAKLLNEGRKVLVFTFKDDGKGRPVDKLKRLIDYYLGHPVSELTSGGELNFLTWGYETATNKYSHCDAVVFAGLLTLPHAEVAGRVFAQSRNIKKALSSEELNRVVFSEQIHSLYQALSRGCCRVMIDGKAKAMSAYVFNNNCEYIQQGLGLAMPMVHFNHNYSAKYIKGDLTQTAQCLNLMLKTLSSHEDDQISKKELYRKLKLDGEFSPYVKKKAFKDLTDDELSFGWELKDRTLYRLEY